MKRLPPAPAVPLSLAEERLLSAYRAMDDRSKQSLIPVAEAWAKNNPRHSRPALHLVVGGAS